jgi:hypothetical protein
MGVMLMGISLTTSCFSQDKQPLAEANLDTIARQMQQRIYERVINLGYIPSPKNYNKTEIIAHNELTMVVLRFSNFEPTADRSAYIGRVFMSERYLERDYNHKYSNRRVYKEDNDGFFYACKLYFDERSLEYRLNIYPDHLLQICRGSAKPFKGMHFNKKPCTSSEQHWESLKHVLALPDKHYDAYTASDDTLSIRNFLTPDNPIVNIETEYLSKPAQTSESDTINFTPTLSQRYPLREINFRKHIKCFRVGFVDDPLLKIGETLCLKFTKYPLSEDMLEGNEYVYQQIPETQLDDTTLKLRSQPGQFVSRNPLYRSLIMSPVPDDNVVPGFEFTPTLALFYWDNTPVKKPALAPGKTTYAAKEQDSKLAELQQKQQPALANQASAKGLLAISSVKKDSIHWLYAGRFTGTIPPQLAPDNDFVVPTIQYLRDTFPVRDPDTRLWLKGAIKFQAENGGYTQQNERWTIRERYLIADDNYNFVYVWVKATKNPPLKKNRR